MKLITLIPILTLAVAAASVSIGGIIVLVQMALKPAPPPVVVVEAPPKIKKSPRCDVYRCLENLP